MHDDEEKVILKMKESLDFLDTSTEVKTPDINQFLQLVSQVEEKKKLGNTMQFIIFLVTAIFVISVETYSFSRSFVFFIIVQAIALACIIPAVVSRTLKKRRQVLNHES